MATSFTNIDRLRIASPCPISWDQMTGDNRVRFCDLCQLNVYNISELSQVETQELIASTQGRLCARLFRRADGTILTKDCPVGLRALRRRVATRSAAMFAAILSLSIAAFGQHPGGNRAAKTASTLQTRITRTNSPANQSVQSLTGTIVDPNGSMIPGARVTLTNAGGKEKKVALANDVGSFQFTSLAPGHYSIRIEAPGFRTLQVTNLIVKKGKVINIDTPLEMTDQPLIGVVAPDAPLLDTSPATPIMSIDIIRRLPIQ